MITITSAIVSIFPFDCFPISFTELDIIFTEVHLIFTQLPLAELILWIETDASVDF
ncbi:MAG: hypothetical protein F6J86_16920 [Symploca sp. SIO1B1]|nr:hypothetical protein [Symploca sp. SIO1B1]